MTSVNKNIQSDYDESKETYKELIEKGRDGIEMMMEVARESEHPREVLSGMIKNVSDVNDRLMDLNKKMKDITGEEKAARIETTNNNVFIGTSTDLQRLLKDVKDKETIDITPEENNGSSK